MFVDALPPAAIPAVVWATFVTAFVFAQIRAARWVWPRRWTGVTPWPTPPRFAWAWPRTNHGRLGLRAQWLALWLAIGGGAALPLVPHDVHAEGLRMTVLGPLPWWAALTALWAGAAHPLVLAGRWQDPPLRAHAVRVASERLTAALVFTLACATPTVWPTPGVRIWPLSMFAALGASVALGTWRRSPALRFSGSPTGGPPHLGDAMHRIAAHIWTFVVAALAVYALSPVPFAGDTFAVQLAGFGGQILVFGLVSTALQQRARTWSMPRRMQRLWNVALPLAASGVLWSWALRWMVRGSPL